MHDFPAGRFAVWSTAWLTGRASYDDALVGDTAHRVAGLPGTDEAVPLGWALSALRGAGERRIRLVLPVPGDVRGLPRVPGLVESAVEAGQAAVGERLALVPEPLGPEVVQWTAVDLTGAPPVPPPVEGSLRAVSGALDLAVGDAARTLAELDLARWHPEVPALLAGLAEAAHVPGMPPGTDPVAMSLLARAQRLAQVLDLALTDAPGGAVNHRQAAARPPVRGAEPNRLNISTCRRRSTPTKALNCCCTSVRRCFSTVRLFRLAWRARALCRWPFLAVRVTPAVPTTIRWSRLLS